MSKITSLNINVVHTEGVPVDFIAKAAITAIRALGIQVVPADQANSLSCAAAPLMSHLPWSETAAP